MIWAWGIPCWCAKKDKEISVTSGIMPLSGVISSEQRGKREDEILT